MTWMLKYWGLRWPFWCWHRFWGWKEQEKAIGMSRGSISSLFGREETFTKETQDHDCCVKKTNMRFCYSHSQNHSLYSSFDMKLICLTLLVSSAINNCSTCISNPDCSHNNNICLWDVFKLKFECMLLIKLTCVLSLMGDQ